MQLIERVEWKGLVGSPTSVTSLNDILGTPKVYGNQRGVITRQLGNERETPTNTDLVGGGAVIDEE